ncbi:MAG TPA: phosphatase PAP2 family protein [Mycobacterium sp.]|nr:phosphatase PAP2 family protein [Mycobacterium sp.]
MIGVVAMVLLGWVVRNGSTSVDDWFHRYGRGPARWLLFFTDPRVLALIVLATIAVALYRRRWRLAIAAAVCPLLAMGLARLLKPLFGRERQGAFAYPSGHSTTVVVVMGMVVLVAGAALWAVLVAVVFCLLGILGQAVAYHYFTDTVGGLLLGTAIVCVVALISARAPHRTRGLHRRPHRT